MGFFVRNSADVSDGPSCLPLKESPGAPLLLRGGVEKVCLDLKPPSQHCVSPVFKYHQKYSFFKDLCFCFPIPGPQIPCSFLVIVEGRRCDVPIGA